MASKFEITYEYTNPGKGIVYVGWDDYQRGRNSDILLTDGISPCLAITIYERLNRLGAMAHISGVRGLGPEAVWTENIVDTLLMNFRPIGVLEATLAGEWENKGKMSDIVKRELQKHKIPVIGEDLGEVKKGRSMRLYCETGKVEVYRYI